MSSQLPYDQLEALLPILPHLARLIRSKTELQLVDIETLLMGIGLEDHTWAQQETARWVKFLTQAYTANNQSQKDILQTALQLRGIPEAQALLAIAEVVGPGNSLIILTPTRLDFGELQAGQTASATVDVQGGPGRVVVESDKVQVQPEQFPAGVTRLQVTVLPVEGGMLYSELRFVGSGGETRLPVLAQWLMTVELAQTGDEMSMPPPVPEVDLQERKPLGDQASDTQPIRLESRVEIPGGERSASQDRAAPRLLPKEIVVKRGVHMNLIPAGSFWMGSNDGDEDEKPVHQVNLDAFYIDIFPVTNRSYAEFLNEAGNQVEDGVTWYSPEDGRLFLEKGIWRVKPGYEEHPVVAVSWYGAVAYCSWRGARLPTEAEWEKAARGGLEGKKYPWGDEDPVCTRGARNGAQKKNCVRGTFAADAVPPSDTVPVGSFAPNGYGLFDMAGNVWEWVWDWFSNSYYQTQSYWNNPQGPTAGTRKVLRGGSFYYYVSGLRTAARSNYYPDGRLSYIGFRCASLPAP